MEAETKELYSLRNDLPSTQTIMVRPNELHTFKGHPFKVEYDTELYELMRSIEENGVLVPLIVRQNPYGSGYEIIAGHRRKAASEWAHEEKIPVMVMNLSDEEATIIMVDTNLQREHLKPSEKAFAYKMKLDAIRGFSRPQMEKAKSIFTSRSRKESAREILKYSIRIHWNTMRSERKAERISPSRNFLTKTL